MSATDWILIAGFLFALLSGLPVVFALGIASILGLLITDIDLIVLAQRVVAGSQVFSLLAIPGFILTGNLMMHGGLSKRLVALCQVLVRRMVGGLGIVTVMAATFFAAISGSAPATTAAIGGIMIPEMEKRGWKKDFSTALATASGPIGQMIPPSIPMIIWGIIAEESISDLFLAGIIPGILIALGLMMVSYFKARKDDISPETGCLEKGALRATLRDSKWALAAPLIILGGIYGGIFTPTEASAFGVVYATFVGLLVHRELDIREIGSIVSASMCTTAMVCSIIAVASAFGWLIAMERLPERLAAAILSVSDNKILILLMINLLLLFVGAIMDNIAAMIILGQVLITIGAQLGIDPIHLGAIVVINFAIGMATPPFGYSLFVGASISGLKVEQVSNALWPMLGVMIFVLMLVTYVPWITLALPQLLN
ncbi:TRAP transporter large permease [Roseovarius sp. MMSF_3350]|uniref:TRAP transporter large permease n=1 Tax=Roseovarius sp. MMSF_3350 TaxID=3046706 RepID=UPI00273D9CFF|nr:TRAP transporter large permease [Roseovarius sp. MMSF_3350]